MTRVMWLERYAHRLGFICCSKPEPDELRDPTPLPRLAGAGYSFEENP